MKNQSYNFLCFIGTAYLSLAIVSLTTDIPTKTVNCIAVGAVLFSIAELIQCISDRRRAIMHIREFSEKKEHAVFLGEYMVKIMKAKFAPSLGKTFLPRLLCYSFACIFIIVGPYGPSYGFLDREKVGVFCTILSLGIILISRYISDINTDHEETGELIDAISTYVGSINESVKLQLDGLKNSLIQLEKRIDGQVKSPREHLGKSPHRKNQNKKTK